MLLQPLFVQTVVPAGPPGALFVPVVLGLAGVYLLLPRARPYPAWWGALAAGLALVLAGWLLVSAEAASAETVLFYAFSGIALVAGGLLITQRNPVRAALAFALVVLSTCGLFLLQAAPFLMAATIIIYAGAIIVTFLFLIMLAQQAGLSSADQRSREPLLSCLAGFALLAALLAVLYSSYSTRKLDALLEQTARAAEQPSEEGMRGVLGDGREFFATYRREADKLGGAVGASLGVAVTEAEASWAKPAIQVPAMQAALRRLRDEGLKARHRYGSLQVPDQVQLSGYSHLPAPGAPGADGPRDSDGTARMPAENVAYLGRTLFTDYLLAVELAGTLLLVATIGAIAIAARRTEGGVR